MAKHTSKEAYFERLRNLGNVNKPALKESQFRNLGSLIDYKRAPDGVAYGIVKENHSYYLKKAGIKQDPNVADFVYIGGLGNITNYQYKSLSEAEKQRNMIFHTINEAVTSKPDINGSRKRRIFEGNASDEIDQAASKLGDLDAATSSEEMPAEPIAEPGLEGGDEMAAGLDAKPAGDGGEVAPEASAEPEAGLEGGGEEMPAPEGGLEGGGEEPAPDAEAGLEGGGEEMPSPEGEEGGEPDVAANTDGSIDEPNRELEKAIGKIANKIRKTDMEDAQVKSYINSYLAAFRDKLRDIDIEDRKEMANKILKVVGQEEIDDLGDSIPQDSPEDSELGPEAGVNLKSKEEEPAMAAEGQCAECGGFGKYAESRGYESPEKFMECDDEEKANVISGYANAHGEGQNDGDFKTIAIVITPEILEKLKGDYGHEEFAGEVEPLANEMNESSEEDKMQQLHELWGGLGNLMKGAGQGIKAGAQAGANAVGNKFNQAKTAVGGAIDTAKAGVQKAATGIKQSYNAGEVPAEVKKLEGVAANLGKQIDALNKRMTAAGQQPIDVKTILKAVTQQVTGKGAGIGGLNPAPVAETANGVDPGNTQVGEPNMLKETDKKVAPGNKVVSEPNMLKEDDEVEEPETDELGGADELGTEPEGEEIEAGEVGIEPKKPEIGFAPATQSLGAGVVKADGAGVEISIEPDKSIQISMNEAKRKLISQIAEGVNVYMNDITKAKQPVQAKTAISEGEVKLRKYVRMRLQEKAGLRKANLNESKKSPALKKLDAVIDEQFKLYESVIKNKRK